jgi:hypothetical protein
MSDNADLLLEVSPVLLVDENEVEVVAHAETLVDLPEGRGEVKAAEEQPYGNGLAFDQHSVSTLELQS